MKIASWVCVSMKIEWEKLKYVEKVRLSIEFSGFWYVFFPIRHPNSVFFRWFFRNFLRSNISHDWVRTNIEAKTVRDMHGDSNVRAVNTWWIFCSFFVISLDRQWRIWLESEKPNFSSNVLIDRLCDISIRNKAQTKCPRQTQTVYKCTRRRCEKCPRSSISGEEYTIRIKTTFWDEHQRIGVIYLLAHWSIPHWYRIISDAHRFASITGHICAFRIEHIDDGFTPAHILGIGQKVPIIQLQSSCEVIDRTVRFASGLYILFGSRSIYFCILFIYHYSRVYLIAGERSANAYHVILFDFFSAFTRLEHLQSTTTHTHTYIHLHMKSTTKPGTQHTLNN